MPPPPLEPHPRQLERMLLDLAPRNEDNVSRTASYLELYASTRAHPPDLPWVLMAHLVSRNGGYMMTDRGASLSRTDGMFTAAALQSLFLFLERANYLIFYDAWWHVLHHLLGRSADLSVPRVTKFTATRCWPAYERGIRERGPTAEVERALVHDLVTNEQNFIERRVVHHPRFEAARAIVGFLESIGRDAPLVVPCSDAVITVGRFAELGRRIETGHRLFDEVLADRQRRDEIYAWACEHPHSGSRAIYGGRAGPGLRDVWPVQRVRALWSDVHSEPEIDPGW
jgi:hypothetical protein